MKKKLNHSLTIALLLLLPMFALAQTPPTMGVAGGFALFTSAGGVTNVGISQITGNVGTNSGLSTGFGNVNGQMHDNDGVSASAAFDLNLAYLNLGGQVPTMFPGIALGLGATFTPAVFSVPAVSTLSGTLTLDGLGDPNACFVFQLNGAFSANPGSQIILINGTKACNVFWRIDGATSMATGVSFAGTIICNGAITLASGDFLDGRALSIVGAVGVTVTTATSPDGCGSPVLTGPLPPNIGSTACYALLTEIGALTNTGVSTITGDVGTNNGPVTGFGLPTIVNGMVHAVPDASTATGSADINILYNYLNLLPYDIELLYPVQFGRSEVLTPHVYLLNAATTFTDTIFLDAQGNANAVFVFQIQGAMSTSTYSNVVLRGGAQSKNVFWKVEGAVDINNYSIFRGTLVANNGAINLFLGDTLDGHSLSTSGAISTSDVFMVISGANASITPSGPTTFCQGGSVTLTASTGTSYLWSTGALTQSITVNSAGTYSVTVTGACGGITTTSIVVTVTPSPVPTITPNGPTSFCVGDSVTLTSSVGVSYMWSTGALTQSITVLTSGNYSVTVVNAGGCSANSLVTVVSVNPMPVATITANGPTTFCQGDSVTLTSSIGNSYLWSNNTTMQSIVVMTAGNYYVIVSNGSGCMDTSAITVVTVNPSPIATITANGPTTFCQGDSVTLTSSIGNSYLWSTNATTQSIVVLTSGSYSVTVTNSNGCSATSSGTVVVVSPLPIATITPNGSTTFCQGDSVTLTASIGISYLWSNGATTQSITVNTSGNYSVIVTGPCGNNTSAITVVTVNPGPPTAGFVSGITGPLSYVFTNASTNASTYNWSFGDSQTSTAVSPSHTYAVIGTYTVILVVTNGCGSDTAIQTIVIVDSSQLEFFNGFSPNGDGHNDYWNIPVLSYYPDNTVLIINRWGEEVWKGSNYDNGTNSFTGLNMKGDALADGTYYYIINYNNTELRGWVFIKR